MALGLVLAAVAFSQALTYTVLHSFSGPDGANPSTRLIRDPDDNLYGVTSAGGTFNHGVIFKLDTVGNLTVLHDFTGGTDGAFPNSLIRDQAGNLYGTTLNGGSVHRFCQAGCGVVFKLDTAGNLTVLHSFQNVDGTLPTGLIEDDAGNFYGTTLHGGNSGCNLQCGVVFRLGAEGHFSVLYTFYAAVGGDPEAGVIRDAAGNLYGTASSAGPPCDSSAGCGNVFALDPTGNLTVLHNFTGGSDGYTPGGLIRDAAGDLYGTTKNGGHFNNQYCAGAGCGVVFKVDPAGNFTRLHEFTGTHDDGSTPWSSASLILDSAGNLYGTTDGGGKDDACPYGCGIVFELDPAGVFTVLHRFSGGIGGSNPLAGLLRRAQDLVGTTTSGGASGLGLVFSLKYR